MSFDTEVLRGFNAGLKIYRQRNPDACLITFDSKPIDCIPAPAPDSTTLLRGGYIESYQSSVACRVDDFDKLPKSGQTLIRQGRTSKILTTDDGGGVSPLLVIHYGTMDE
jgi:hypothetical protein